MRELRLGIAYEGGIDADIIAAIVKRVLESEGFTFNGFNPQTNGTVIVDFVPSYARKFIEADVDIAIFCTDQDKHPHNRKTEIEAKIRSVDEAFLLKCAIGVAIPHLEAWLLVQDHVVKNILGYDASKPLPNPHLQPKDRLLAAYSEAPGEYEGSTSQLRIQIAETMDIAQCSRACTDFKNFVQSIRSAVGNI